MYNTDAHRLFNVMTQSLYLVFKISPVKFWLKLKFLLNSVD